MSVKLSLYATLPTMTNERGVRRLFEAEDISGVRLNTGVFNPYSPAATLEVLKKLSAEYGKPLWVDLKARQLRITQWADPDYQCIELNHNISCKLPAKVLLRGEDALELTYCQDNKIVVSPPPRHAVGRGQSVNIISEDLTVHGGLTELDREYIEACRLFGHTDMMLSYVESTAEAEGVRALYPQVKLTCKLETPAGIKAAPALTAAGFGLMAARDDLFLEMGRSPAVIPALREIVRCDGRAICASRIFSSLEKGEYAAMSDYEDIQLMRSFGYRRFMLSDNISGRHLDKALEAWRAFTRG